VASWGDGGEGEDEEGEVRGMGRKWDRVLY